MDKRERARLRNNSFNAMIAAHDLKESTDNKTVLMLCEMLYEAHHALYMMLSERTDAGDDNGGG